MIQAFFDYSAAFFRFAGKRAHFAIALTICGALLDGVGLAMLVPVLELFSGTDQSGLSVWIATKLNQLGVTSREGQLLLAMAAFLIVLLARNLIGWKRDTTIMALSQGFVDQWRQRMFSAIAIAHWPKVMSHQRTDLEHAITVDVSRLSVGTDRILRGGVTFAMMLVQLGLAFALSPLLTTIVIGFIAVSALLLFPLVQRARRIGEQLTRSGRSAHKVLGQFMAGLKLAKAHDAQEKYANQFQQDIAVMRDAGLKFSSDQMLSRAAFQFASGVVVCLVIIIGLFWLEIKVPVLIVVLIIMGRLTAPFMSLVQSVQSFANMLPAWSSLKACEADLLAGGNSQPPHMDHAGRSLNTSPARVELQGISFTHHGQSGGGLDNVSCLIEQGRITTLIGPSGAGKTTLVDIVTGLLHPASGHLLIDGIEAGPGTGTQIWNGGLAYVPQDPFLFDVSIRDNLIWPADGNIVNLPDAEIWQALEVVGAADFIRSTPGQLDARAGERGQTFSGGERQRLCLARALIRKPRLLILDEATNAMDTGLETEILERLATLRGKTTILIITHRLTSIDSADHVLMIENGRIIQKR